MTWKVFLGRAGVNSLSMKRPYSGRIWTWSVASGAGAYSHGTPAREDIPHEAVGRLGGRLSAFLVSVMTRRLWHRPPVRLPMHPTLLGLAWRDRYGLLPPDLVSDLHPWTVGGCLRRIRPIRRLAWERRSWRSTSCVFSSTTSSARRPGWYPSTSIVPRSP